VCLCEHKKIITHKSRTSVLFNQVSWETVMLANELRTFLSGVVADELIDVYVRFINLLSEKEIFTSYYYILELINTRENFETASWVLRLNDIIAGQVDAILADFGIELTDEISVPESLAFLEALLLIEHWDDRARLTALIDDADDTVCALTDVISEISTIPNGTILPWIKSVSPAFIENIISLSTSSGLTEDAVMLPDDYERYEKIKTMVRQYLTKKEDGHKFDSLITIDGYRLLTPFRQLLTAYISKGYFTLLLPEYHTAIMTDGIKAIIKNTAYDLVGIGLISGEIPTSVRETTASVISQLALPDQIVMELLAQVNEGISRSIPNG